ncbi:MAG: HAD family hydrolase [Janthinobacterium lividum]
MDTCRALSPQTLLFDADDTLWENNIYFETAISAFVSYLDHRVHTPEEVRERLNQCERATIAQFGYGVKSFRRSLINCFEQLSLDPVTPQKHARIVAFADAISSEEVRLLPEVAPTLQILAERHRLLLVTKGDREEQVDKLERSGLRSYFTAVEVPAEKNAPMYRDLVHRHQLDPGATWMIGNSPRSDVNSALAAGLNAVSIPHDLTWALEHEVIDPPPRSQVLIELSRFSELLRHF